MNPHPSELVKLLKNNPDQVVFFIGAGFSQNAGLRNWAQLVLPLAKEIDFDIPAEAKYQTADHYLSAVQYYENKYGKNALISYVREVINSGHVSTVHRLLTVLPIQYIFTTNYDTLIEDTYKEARITCSVMKMKEDVSQTYGQVKLVKLCGDTTNLKSLTITKTDFNNLLDEKKEVMRYVRTTLETKTAVFLGYSMRDPFLNQIWDRIRYALESYVRRAYAVMFDINELEKTDLELRDINVINLEGSDDKGSLFRGWMEKLTTLTLENISPERLQVLRSRYSDPGVQEVLQRIESGNVS